MMLLSGMFCGDSHGFDYTPTAIKNINKITIKNGVFDEIFGSKGTNFDYQEENKKWDFNTVMYALFQNNLFGGNVAFTADTVSAMRIKRRKKGTYEWLTIFEVPIYTNEDFSFERFDRYARGGTEYEYSLVPIMSGNIEGNLNTNSVKSEFDGFYFVEKDVLFRAFTNVQLSHERNHNGTTINTLGRRFPYYVTNGQNSYNSGSLQASFYDIGLNDEIITDGSWEFREMVDNFLTNGNIKILKSDEGKMWMVAIVDNVPQEMGSHWNMPVHTISWVEVGDCESTSDLYNNNFIDLDTRLVR